MPAAPTYPGVYIEEGPSGVRTITGVATSIAAFIGYFKKGPMNEARRILSALDFERDYGGLIRGSEAAYALDQFFLNGGTQAWIVRTAGGSPAKSAVHLGDAASATPTAVLEVEAVSAGTWGDDLRIEIDYGTAKPDSTFNLEVLLMENGQVAETESFLNLTMAQNAARSVGDVVNEGSKLVRVKRTAGNRPAQNGTVSEKITAFPSNLAGQLTVDIGGAQSTTGALPSPKPTTLQGLATALQKLIRGAANASKAQKKVTVTVVGSIADGAFLKVAGGTDAAVVKLSGNLATNLKLAGPANVARYELGKASVANTAQIGAGTSGATKAGDDGSAPGAAELKTALDALDKVELFNILCIPDTVRLNDTAATAVAAEAITYCKRRRAFYILDIPHPANNPRDSVEEAEAWISERASLRHENVAAYFPRPKVADPLSDFRLRAVAPSGTIAGLYARTDLARGVWKAPAGLDARLRGVQELEVVLNDGENGVLNPLGISCLRNFRVAGNVCWGARTLVGADQLASEWKYVPVRRLALFLEESLYRGTQWVVFEPNDEPLWSQIRLNIGAFMQSLFRQGAFQGTKPRDAYLVKCDKETTTQDDINRGIVNIVVGFAPLKPAEFVILKIRQLAGQTEG